MNLIYPTPKSCSIKEGYFNFGKSLVFTVDKSIPTENLSLYGELFSNFTAGGTYLNEHICAEAVNDKEYKLAFFATDNSRLNNGFNFENAVSDAEYKINVSEGGVAIAYRDKNGLSHAISTLLQLIEILSCTENSYRIPCCEICDKPIFKFNGVHFCVFPETSLDVLEKEIRLAGLLKYTHIVIEFWGMLRYECLDALAWQNAYTKQQIKPLLSLCRAFGAEPVPMFNHFGHATASRSAFGRHVVLDNDPTLETLFEPDGWTWCMSNPDTVSLLKNVRDELCELFGNGSYFHIGCDEAYSFATCPKCNNENKLTSLANYFNGICGDICNNNRVPLMWGDALLADKDWKHPICATGREDQKTYEILDKLDKRVIINDWQYDVVNTPVETIKHFKNHGFRVVACPWDNLNNMKALAYGAQDDEIFGYLQTTWHTLSNNINTLPLGAELSWNGRKANTEQTLLRCYVARLIRKVMPSGGDFQKSGWRTCETTMSHI